MKGPFFKTVACSLLALLSVTYATEAHAYKLYGGKYTQSPYSQKYYNDATTYSTSSLMNHYLAFDSAVSSWSNTSHTYIWWVKTTTQSDSILDVTSLSDNDTTLFGRTEHYVGNTVITDVKNNYWYWARCWTNTNATWDNSMATYKTKGLTLQEVSAHEVGHALGLDHTGNSMFDYASYGGTLMFYSPDPYWGHGIYGPTSDEVSGVQKMYGTRP
ncbi:matrixin family metalloprotease [Tumebacillus sp. ITR2]|uniref:Matrixin family metalloprotease n=1 Tax=Tumebacillus amylolyticus TaxID=2801339 RepID=A0ABS1JDB3_9BACL|nr:matrixin family metalloprotease [Tumebacillus amylolyticus]MBL0388251.1 matrixin family metalloprotease [Tumebacillus amylolyticus]